MLSRRRFVAGSAGLALAGATAAGGLSYVARAGGGAVRPDAVVFDPRHASARAFADALEGFGSVAVPMRDSAAWYRTLRARLGAGSRSLAGAGTHSAFLVAASLAREHGLRLRYRSLHQPEADGRFSHRLTAPAPLQRALSDLAGAGAQWPLAVAARLDATPVTAALTETLCHADGLRRRHAPLTCWLFA